MYRNIVFVFTVALVVVSSICLASNPADLTGFYHPCPTWYFKAGYDDGPRWTFLNVPFSETASGYIYPWENEDGTVKETELALAISLSSKVDLGMSTVISTSTGNSAETTNTMFLDLHQNRLGLGFSVPLSSEDEIKVGPRYKLSQNVSVFATYERDTEPTCYGKGWQIEIAKNFESNTSFVRMSLTKGKWHPELRLKFTDDKDFVGFGLGHAF